MNLFWVAMLTKYFDITQVGLFLTCLKTILLRIYVVLLKYLVPIDHCLEGAR